MEMYKQILDQIFNFFISSVDYNGIPLTRLEKNTGFKYLELIEIIKKLVINGDVSIQAGINPHIIRLGHYDTQTQLELLEDAKKNKTKVISTEINITCDNHLVCLYPSQNYLQRNRNTSKLSSLPFNAQLALGEPHLKPLYFEIEVLDRYFKDPRYSFNFEDYSGKIIYAADKHNKPLVAEEDQVFIKSFGLGFDKNKNRIVVVYLGYLDGLTSEHQLYWKNKEAKRECKMLKEYYINTIEGVFTNSYSIFSGFIGEQRALNDLATKIFGKPLFNMTFEDENRPKEFTFFFIPTLKNYHDFVQLLDKMISDNINKSFFKNQAIELYDYIDINKNIVERKEKGTIKLFEEWLTMNYNLDSPSLIKDLLKPFRTIRKERQDPAHKINENIFDKKLIDKQKKMMEEAYWTVRTLRKIFQTHSKAKNVIIDKWLDEGEVKIF